MKKQLLVGIVFLLLFVGLSGCETDQDSNMEFPPAEEPINVKILDTTFDIDIGEGADENRTTFIYNVKLYNEGGEGYATILFEVCEQLGMYEFGDCYEDQQVLHLDAKEYREITFIAEDLGMWDSYAPSVWVEYE